MSEELPEGWIESSIGSLFTFKYGKALKAEDRSNSGSANVYGSNGIVGLHDKALTSGPTIIIGRKGSVGEVHFSKTPCWPIDTTYYIDEFPCGLLPEFWELLIRSLQLGQQEKSSAIPGINRDSAYQTAIPLPPLAEQKRIVEKLDAVLGKVDVCRQRLERIPTILKRFRQSVLAAACSGKLTADWREENVGYFDSSGSELPSIPRTWSWITFSEVIEELRNGLSPKPSIEPPGIPILRISAARRGLVDLSDHRFLPNGEQHLEKYGLRDGDLMFTRYNGSLDLLGVCGMTRGLETQPCLYPDKLMRVRLDESRAKPEFVEAVFSDETAHARLIEKAKSSAGQNGISGKDLKMQLIPLPPLDEQQEIVRRVNALFSLADSLEGRYQNAKTHVDKLTQSVLAKAFRGELVPTEAELARREGREYEPASVLLERIHAERESRPKPARKRAARKRTAKKRS